MYKCFTSMFHWQWCSKYIKACHINEAWFLNKCIFSMDFVDKQRQLKLRLHNYDLRKWEKTLQAIIVSSRQSIVRTSMLNRMIDDTYVSGPYLRLLLISPSLLHSISTIHLHISVKILWTPWVLHCFLSVLQPVKEPSASTYYWTMPLSKLHLGPN